MRSIGLLGVKFVILGSMVCAGWLPIATTVGQGPERGEGSDTKQEGFAYDPQKEEGPHPESDFEWWYHFGFLKTKGADRFEYSFVSSFQRNKKGRYLFYNLSDLATGENRHCAFVDRSLFDLDDKPDSSQAAGERPLGKAASPGIGKRLARWLQDALPLLPEGHEFMAPPDPSATPPKSELWLCYGENRFLKEDSSYRAVYKNKQFSLDLTLRRQGPPLPVLGTGLTGLHKPEDQYYYTYPRLPAVGQLRIGKDARNVEGQFWYDHQWGKIVTKTPMKWCWWGLRLKDGRNLSIFRLQEPIKGETVQQGITVHHPDGKTEVYKDVTFVPGRTWKSPHRRKYVVEWEIKSPRPAVTIQVRPHFDNHELPVLLYGWIWEGPCLAELSVPGGETVKGSGFQELIGQVHD